MRRVLLVLIFFFAFFLLPIPTFAQEGWTIDNFQSTITPKPDGTVLIQEQIDVDFNSIQKHGIYRDIPIAYQNPSGPNTYTDITVSAVGMDNSQEQNIVSYSSSSVRIQIGNPNQTISGKHTYTIVYSVTGILRSFSDHDELFWNATSNNWPVPIEHAMVVVTMPATGINKIACFEGPYGSTETCSSSQASQTQANFSTSRSLGISEGLTVVVGYTKGMLPILASSGPKNITSRGNLSNFSWDLRAFVLTIGCGIGLLLLLIIKRRNSQTGYQPVVVEYTPPNNLRPAEIGTLVDERADTLDVTATVVDLAARGYLTITEIPKKWLFGSVDYTLANLKKDTQSLNEYERVLLNRLFQDGDSEKLSELKYEFYQDLKTVKKKLYENVVDKNLFSQNPESVRSKYVVIGILILFLGVFLLFIGLTTSGLMSGFGTGLIVDGVLVILFSASMPRRSALGAQLNQRIKGYKLFISEAEKYKQKFFEKENIFNEVLPYAIVFGLTEKFAKAMKDMDLQPASPSWYYGTTPFNPIFFASNISNFSNSMSSAIAAAPQSSGGFSSGGGFSGGGFGGGGGGSW